MAAKAALAAPRARDSVARTFAALARLLRVQTEDGSEPAGEFRVTSATRAQPAWSEVEIEWQNLDLSLSELSGALVDLQVALEGLEEANLLNYDGLLMDVASAQQSTADLRAHLVQFIPHPNPEAVYWTTGDSRGDDVVLHGAPLRVGDALDLSLFSTKGCVVMTSATLSADGTFDHMTDRTGFADAEELLVGSPFDYPKAALLCVPEDMPEPNSWAYQGALEQAVIDAAESVGGRTMALFTSHRALQQTASAVRSHLQARGINVLAQGVDGTPQQLLSRFLENPGSVLLGTASFWEGVDLAGESLKVLLVARLPFNVPTEPVFAARSELYDDPFGQYAVPQAVLRLRQGFGRLIRTKADRGVAVILDRRITSRAYGKAFVDSLPPMTLSSCSLRELSDTIRSWVGD